MRRVHAGSRPTCAAIPSRCARRRISLVIVLGKSPGGAAEQHGERTAARVRSGLLRCRHEVIEPAGHLRRR
eukprot:2741910-Pyramimonas_sp.AAC.1